MSREKMCIFAKRPVFTPALDFPEGPVQAVDGPKRELGTGDRNFGSSLRLYHSPVCGCVSHHRLGLPMEETGEIPVLSPSKFLCMRQRESAPGKVFTCVRWSPPCLRGSTVIRKAGRCRTMGWQRPQLTPRKPGGSAESI